MYRLTELCWLPGGGPFEVDRVTQSDDGHITLRVVYAGSDREWAQSQPGTASDPDLRSNRDPDVVGTLNFADVTIEEQITDIPLSRAIRGSSAHGSIS